MKVRLKYFAQLLTFIAICYYSVAVTIITSGYEWDPESWTGLTNCSNGTAEIGCGQRGSKYKYQRSCRNESNSDQNLTSCANQPYDIEYCDKCCPEKGCQQSAWVGWLKCMFVNPKQTCGSGYNIQEQHCLTGIINNETSWICNDTIAYRVKECFQLCRDVCEGAANSTEITVASGSSEARFSSSKAVYVFGFESHDGSIPSLGYTTHSTNGINEFTEGNTSSTPFIASQISMNVIKVNPNVTMKVIVKHCEIPEFKEWSNWSPCISDVCNMTVRSINRTRQCIYENEKPAPKESCNGKTIEYKICSNATCFELTDWYNSTNCLSTRPCGYGLMEYKRDCVAYFNGTKYTDQTKCSNYTIENRTCHVGKPCYEYHEWSEWSSCGAELKHLNMHWYPNNIPLFVNGMMNFPKFFASLIAVPGTNANGTTEVTEGSGEPPINGTKSSKTADGKHSTTAGSGSASYQNMVQKPCFEQNGTFGNFTIYARGRVCYADNITTHSSYCNGSAFEIVSENKNETECSATCDSGTKIITTSCNVIGTTNKSLCLNYMEKETKKCMISKCPMYRIQNATEWTECSSTCDTGVKELVETCHFFKNGSLVSWENCSHMKETPGVMLKPCRVRNCSDVFEVRNDTWSQCSATCVGGTKSMGRHCFNNIKNKTSEWENCLNHTVLQPIEQTVVMDCNSNYSCFPYEIKNRSIGECNVTCYQGHKPMERYCQHMYTKEPLDWLSCHPKLPATHIDLKLPTIYYEQCTSSEYCGPVSGTWLNWGEWGKCSVSCGNGTRLRNRECYNSTHYYLEEVCKGGTNTSFSKCIEAPCQTNETWGFGEWSVWGECSVTCGSGIRGRSRECNDYGREENSPCKLITVQREKEKCDSGICPIHGGWSEWSSWGNCSKPCGFNRTKSRFRSCDNPVPQYDGKSCKGENVTSANCSLKLCKANGEWTSWNGFGKCSAPCGGGWSIRKRSCEFPAFRPKGDPCKGNSTEKKPCNNFECKIVRISMQVKVEDEKCYTEYDDSDTRKRFAEDLRKNIIKATKLDPKRVKDVIFHNCRQINDDGTSGGLVGEN